MPASIAAFMPATFHWTARHATSPTVSAITTQHPEVPTHSGYERFAYVRTAVSWADTLGSIRMAGPILFRPTSWGEGDWNDPTQSTGAVPTGSDTAEITSGFSRT